MQKITNIVNIIANTGSAALVTQLQVIGFNKLHSKLVFVGLAPDYLSLRTSAYTGVAIPRIEGKCTEKHPKMGTSAIFGGNRYLVSFNRGIATTSVRTGLAMTAFFQTTICLAY